MKVASHDLGVLANLLGLLGDQQLRRLGRDLEGLGWGVLCVGDLSDPGAELLLHVAELAGAKGDTRFVRELRGRLEGYERRLPLREQPVTTAGEQVPSP